MRSSSIILVFLHVLGAGIGQTCLQTPPGLPGGNGQNGAMFDVQATGGTVLIQDFRSAFSATNVTAIVEVYAVTGGGTFVGKETNPSLWTLIGTSGAILTTGPGTAQALNLNLSLAIPASMTQGFYITCNNGQSVDYTNGTGTPGVSIVTSDSFITITEGVGKSYPFGTTFTPRNWNGDVCYLPGSGLFANFSATPTSGAAPLAVQFSDQSISSDPAGIQSWMWSFGDGNTSMLANPSHTYTCPGLYNVSLTVTDTMHPTSTMTRNGYISINGAAFTMLTTGGGVGDLTIVPVSSLCYPGAVRGFTLPSLTTPTVVGGGPFLGLVPDIVTYTFITQPALPGGVPHFLVVPNQYPNSGPLSFPPGFFSSLTGLSMDAVEILLDSSGIPIVITNVSRVTF